MSCKTLLDNPNSTVTPVNSDVVYFGTITSPFVTNLYSFDMIESEVITFNFNIVAFTTAIELYLELYKINESTGEYDSVGTSYIDQIVNSIDYDITPGQYAFCLTSTKTPMQYEMLLEFTEFPFIVFPQATAYDGSSVSIDVFDEVGSICDSVIVYSIVAGKLPPNFIMGNNGVIQGLLPEIDCVTNDATFKGIHAPVAEFQVNFEFGLHAYIYNYGPDDFAIFTGSSVEIDLKTNTHVGQEFIAEYGFIGEAELTTYRENEFYHGSSVDMIFTTFPEVKTDGDNYDITDEIPPSFSLYNNNQGDDTVYFPTQVEWEFTVRAAFDEDKSQYLERTFKICMSNNWDSDQANFDEAFDSFETDVFTEAELLDAEARLELTKVVVETDNEEIPEQPIEFDAIIKAALAQPIIDEPVEIELCMPCIVPELPRIREIDTSGLCVCDTDIVEVEEVEPELVKGIEINCASDFVKSMFTEMACIPIEPCGIPTVHIRTPIYRETIKIEPQCDDTCN